MPEFIADTDGTVDGKEWADIPDFAKGYIEALLFTNVSSESMVDVPPDHEFQDGSIPADAGFGDFFPASLANILADCDSFYQANVALLEEAKELVPGSENFRYAKEELDDRRLGMLFFYDDQGHGVSFTDDGDAECLEKLRKAALYYRERSITWGTAADGTESPTGYGFIFVE